MVHTSRAERGKSKTEAVDFIACTELAESCMAAGFVGLLAITRDLRHPIMSWGECASFKTAQALKPMLYLRQAKKKGLHKQPQIFWPVAREDCSPLLYLTPRSTRLTKVLMTSIAKPQRQTQRFERYELQSINRGICITEGKKLGLEHPANFHRSCKCCHIAYAEPQIHQEITSKSAFYAGIIACGSVWACPICAAKIERKRAGEIDLAMAWVYKEVQGNERRGAAAMRVNNTQAMMLTFTFPHSRDDALADLLDRFNKALRQLRSGKAWKNFKESVGYRGLIRATEITLGQNGWHPHTHELWIMDQGIDAETVKERIQARWLRLLEKHGFIHAGDEKTIAHAKRHALDVKAEVHAGEYLQKLSKEDTSPEALGISRTRGNHELARASTKVGRSKGLSAFQILRLAGEGSAFHWDKWVEYLAATHGKSRLFWSRGLKKLVGIQQDKTDEELATEQTERADLLGLLTHKEWRLIRKEARDKSGVLDAAEAGGWTAVQAYIKQLQEADKAWIAD